MVSGAGSRSSGGRRARSARTAGRGRALVAGGLLVAVGSSQRRRSRPTTTSASRTRPRAAARALGGVGRRGARGPGGTGAAAAPVITWVAGAGRGGRGAASPTRGGVAQGGGEAAASGNRSAGSFDIARRTTAARSAGTSAGSSGTGSRRWASAVATGVSPTNGPAAGEALEGDDAERVDVGGRAWRCRPAACSGERYCGRAHDLAGLGQRHPLGGAGDAEVGDLDPAVGRDEQVGRLDVAVDDAGGVGGADRVGGLRHQVARRLGVQRPVRRASAPRAAGRRPAPSPGRAGVRPSAVLAVVVDRGDARVVERGGVLRLGGEAGAERRVVGVLGLEQLDRDRRGRAGCRWRARPRPCRRWRSGSRGGSARRRRRSARGGPGHSLDHRLHDRLGDRAAQRAAGDLAALGAGVPSGSSPPPRPAGRRRARTR